MGANPCFILSTLWNLALSHSDFQWWEIKCVPTISLVLLLGLILLIKSCFLTSLRRSAKAKTKHELSAFILSPQPLGTLKIFPHILAHTLSVFFLLTAKRALFYHCTLLTSALHHEPSIEQGKPNCLLQFSNLKPSQTTGKLMDAITGDLANPTLLTLSSVLQLLHYCPQ